ncbi:MAG: hemerythrin domain-containing protein [Peptococcaceae bacterium]|nr:hemerythrin domain-containing protein [Peptococcaceae bacterium]
MELIPKDHNTILELIGRVENQLVQSQTFTELEPDLQKFITVWQEVIAPHFEAEETGLYPDAASEDGDTGRLVLALIEEHQIMTHTFRHLIKAFEQKDVPIIISYGIVICDMLREHIKKEQEKLGR